MMTAFFRCSLSSIISSFIVLVVPHQATGQAHIRSSFRLADSAIHYWSTSENFRPVLGANYLRYEARWGVNRGDKGQVV